MKRLKRRYIALQIEADQMPTEHDFIDALWATVTKMYGEYGASLASLALIKYECGTKFAIVRANLDFVDNVRAAFATLTSLCGHSAALHVTAVSGTIKSLREGLSE